MKYLLLIYSNEQSWASLSTAQREGIRTGHAAFHGALVDSGELVHSGGLADPQLTRTVRVRDGLASETDGPYAEAKEHLAGYYVVECGAARAAELAALIPDARYTGVEIRPLMDHSGLEM